MRRETKRLLKYYEPKNLRILRNPGLLVLVGIVFSSIIYSAEKPNILLILSDDHSLPHVGAYGGPNCQRFNITPNLDALSAESMRFNRAYTAAPQCAPSRASIFAGRSPIGLAATRFAQPARSGTRFFTDALRESGFWVGLDGRHQHLDGRAKDSENVSNALVGMGMRGEEFESRFDHFVRSAGTKKGSLEKVPQMLNTALDKVPQGKPFFLYFGFSQPHRTWGEDHEGIDPKKLTLPPDWPDLPEVRLDYARYLADVRDLDTGIGMVEGVLKKRGLKENTLLIFMGDNGEALLRGKGTLFGRGLNVPLMVRWPGKVKPGSVSDALISGVDLAPTILEAAGLAATDGMTGKSFLAELHGNPYSPREHVLAERGWHFGPITRTDGFDLSRSITTKRYNFIYNALPNRSYTPVDMPGRLAWEAIREAHKRGELSAMHERLYFQNPRPIFELYDLEKDPFEINNLSGRKEMVELEAAYREDLDLWMIKEGDYLPLPTHAFQNQNR